MRFFGSDDLIEPTRDSRNVDIRLPTVPPATEVAARDATLGIIVTGRAHPGLQVRCSVGERSTTVSAGSGRWQAYLSAPEGAHQVRVVVLGYALGQSTVVTAEVAVSAPPAIPLQLQYPEIDRKISRVTRVTGSATPRSDIEVSLGGGTATAKANEGGAWEVPALQSDLSGPLGLLALNLTTGEAVERAVEVEYFPQWEVTELVAGPLMDETGLVTPVGAIARGTGDAGHTITLGRESNPNAPVLLEVPVEEDDRWEFRHTSSPPAPPFTRGVFHLRATGDPVPRTYRASVQAPLILVPEEGQATGPQPIMSGFAAVSFDLELPDGTTLQVARASDFSWRVQLPPLPPGIHVITARVRGEEREISRRKILVLEQPPEAD